jgi:hypothetical protein
MSHFTFGRYNGRTYQSVAQENPSYIVWAAGSARRLCPDLPDALIARCVRAIHRPLPEPTDVFGRPSRFSTLEPRPRVEERTWREKGDDGETRTHVIRPGISGEPEHVVYNEDGSGYLKCGGPCGDLYFDRNGDT